MAARELVDYMKGRTYKGFVPHPFYCEIGDYLTYFFEDEDFYAERIDDVLTVYLSMDGDDFVGFKLKGVAHLLETLGDFTIHVEDEDGEITLGMLFLVGMQLTTNPKVIEYYQRFARDTQKIAVKKRELQPA